MIQFSCVKSRVACYFFSNFLPYLLVATGVENAAGGSLQYRNVGLGLFAAVLISTKVASSMKEGRLIDGRVISC